MSYFAASKLFSSIFHFIFTAHLQPRETLFHFTAHLGLTQVATVLLGKPGSEEALRLTNRHGYLPREIALDNCFDGLAELLSK